MFARHKKIIILVVTVILLAAIFFPLKNLFSANGRADTKPSIFSYEGLIQYSRQMVEKYPQHTHLFALYFPYVFLNLLKAVILLIFSLLVYILLKHQKTQPEIETKFDINWTLGDIIRVYLLALLIHSISIFVWEDILTDNIPLWIVIEATFQSLLLGGFIFIKVVHVKERKLSAIGFIKLPLKDLVALVLKTVVIMVLIAGILSFLLDYEIMPAGRWVKLFQGTRTVQQGPFIFLQLLLLMLIAPVCEEMFFRGFLYPFIRNKFGFQLGAVLVSILFAILHLNLLSSVLLFVLSMLLCMLYERTKNLTYPIIVHAFYNIFLTTGFVVDLIK